MSASGALNNLRIETAGKNFGQLCAQAGQKWEDALSVIDVKGDYDQVCNIYSSMYHTISIHRCIWIMTVLTGDWIRRSIRRISSRIIRYFLFGHLSGSAPFVQFVLSVT